MASAIDATKPADSIAASKADLRANLAAAKSEIEALQTQVGTLSPYVFYGARNRLLNSSMNIDQRNAGVAKSIPAGTTTGLFGPDRWHGVSVAAGGVFSLQQLTASPPTGFSSYLRVLVTTNKGALASADYHYLGQAVEGYNWYNMLYGTSSALPAVLTFWVRGSIAGNYSVALQNAAGANSCVVSYTINSANVWEFKTVLFSACTIGTWSTVNTTSVRLRFDLGSGTNFNAVSANVWAASGKGNIVGAVSLIGTTSATLDITGVQLEPGTAATPYENRMIATELMTCQRYFSNGQFSYGGSVTIGNTVYSFVTINNYLRGTPTIVRSTESIVNLTTPTVTPAPTGFIIQGTGTATGAFLWGANYAADSEIVL